MAGESSAEAKSTASSFPYVAGLLLLLAAATIVYGPIQREWRLRAGKALAQKELLSLRISLGAYHGDNTDYPTTSHGLTALIFEPAAAPLPKNWRGPYTEWIQIPLDPWGRPYVYRLTVSRGVFDLFSCGPDRTPDTADDLR